MSIIEESPGPLLSIVIIAVACTAIAYRVTGTESTKRVAVAAVEKSGHHSVQLVDAAIFKCDADDTFGASFVARREYDNKVVSGAVCCGVLKRCVVRW